MTSMNTEPSDSVFEADDRISHGSELFRSKTRGSVFHYHDFFPDDPWLVFWCGLIRFNEVDHEGSLSNIIAASALIPKDRISIYIERFHGRV